MLKDHENRDGLDSSLSTSSLVGVAQSDPLAASAGELITLEQCIAGFRNGNHESQVQFERDSDMLIGAMLRQDGQAHYLRKLFSLLLATPDIFYCSKSKSKFNPAQNDCTKFEDPQYERLINQPKDSEKLPIGSILCHRARLLLETDVSGLQAQFIEWLVTDEGQQGFYRRFAATHGIAKRPTPLLLGDKISKLKEIKLGPFLALVNGLSRIKGSSEELYAIDLALGIDGANPISGKTSESNGEHGHAFLLINEEGVLAGFEPAAANRKGQSGEKHGYGTSTQDYTLTGGDPLGTAVNKDSFPGIYTGLSGLDTQGLYGLFHGFVSDEAQLANAKALYEYLTILINEDPDNAKQLLKKLLLSCGFVDLQVNTPPLPSVFQSFNTRVGQTFRFRAQDGTDFDHFIPNVQSIKSVDISLLKEEYHRFLNQCLQGISDENLVSPQDRRYFLAELAKSDEAKSGKAKMGYAHISKIKPEAIVGQFLRFASKEDGSFENGFRRIQIYDEKIEAYLRDSSNTYIAQLVNICLHLAQAITELQNVKKGSELAIINFVTEYKNAQRSYQELLSANRIPTQSKKVDYAKQSSFSDISDEDLVGFSPDQLMTICLEELDKVGVDSKLLNKILSAPTLSDKLLQYNKDQFEGRPNIDRNVSILKGIIAICTFKNTADMEAAQAQAKESKGRSSMSEKATGSVLKEVNRLSVGNLFRDQEIESLKSKLSEMQSKATEMEKLIQALQAANANAAQERDKALTTASSKIGTIRQELQRMEAERDEARRSLAEKEEGSRDYSSGMSSEQEDDALFSRPRTPNVSKGLDTGETSVDGDSQAPNLEEVSLILNLISVKNLPVIFKQVRERLQASQVPVEVQVPVISSNNNFNSELMQYIEKANDSELKALYSTLLLLHKNQIRGEKDHAAVYTLFFSMSVIQMVIVGIVCNTALFHPVTLMFFILGGGLLKNISGWISSAQELKALETSDPLNLNESTDKLTQEESKLGKVASLLSRFGLCRGQGSEQKVEQKNTSADCVSPAVISLS